MNFDYSLSTGLLFSIPVEYQNVVQTPATPEDLDRVLNLLKEEVGKMEKGLLRLPSQSYHKSLLLVREKMLVLADRLTRSFQTGVTALNLRIRSQRAIAEIRACEETFCAVPSEIGEKNILLNKKIEALNLDPGPNPKFHLPDQKKLQACTQEEIARLQAAFATVHMGGIDSMSHLNPFSNLYEGACQEEYSRIERGVAIQFGAAPFIALAKIEHELVDAVANEIKIFCQETPLQRQFCEKTAELMGEALEWTKSRIPEGVKVIVREGRQVAEKVEENLESNYFVPIEVTQEAIAGARIVGETVLLNGLSKAVSLTTSFSKALVRDIREAKMASAQRKILQLPGPIRGDVPFLLPAYMRKNLLVEANNQLGYRYFKNSKKLYFKEFTVEDVPIYYRWAGEEHVKNVWFLNGYQPKEYILKKLEGNGIEYPFLILANNKPIGYIQYWDVHARDIIEITTRDYFTGSAPGTFGIDLFIGEIEYLGKGYGTEVLRYFSHLLLEKHGAKKIVVDPSLANKAAIRCYEKAGFKWVGLGDDPTSGEVAIMEIAK